MSALQGYGVVLNGFVELNDALERIGGGKADFGLEYELQRRLKVVGEKVAARAPEFVSHNTRSGESNGPRLEDSVRMNVTKRRASVYSTSPYGGAQQYGASPKAGWSARGPHIQRRKASKWMSRAVEAESPAVYEEMESLLGWLVDEFHRG